jgi:uncharacterized protein (TIGR02271 family)
MEHYTSSNPSLSQQQVAREENGDTIPVFSEDITVQKKEVVTGKVSIKKTVQEEVQTVSTPVVSDDYEIVRVPVHPTVLMVAPEPVRHEGDTMIIPVVREIMVLEKRFEIIEEIHIRHNKQESISTQQISLKKEHVDIKREG